MNRFLAVLMLFVASWAAAGDEFQFPHLRPGSYFKASSPAYEVIGIENNDGSPRLWVVASPDVVLTQRGVNGIILSIERHMADELGTQSSWDIRFYSSVRDKPQFPAFRITDELAVYDRRENKTYFLSGKQTYGGWAHGPVH